MATDPTCDVVIRMLHAARQAGGTRVALLSTRDRDHALAFMKRAAVCGACPLYRFTVSGRFRYDATRLTWSPLTQEVADLHGLFEHVRELRESCFVVIEDALLQLRDEGGDTRARMRLADLLSVPGDGAGVVVVFLEPPESVTRVPALLADQFVRMDMPYPQADELAAIAREELVIAGGGRLSLPRIQDEAALLGRELAGLTRSAARDALRDALAIDPTNLEAARARLQIQKGNKLQRDLAMRVLGTEGAELPVGLDYLVEYLDTIRGRLTVRGVGRARGVLLIGPPGTGKTMLARAIGRLVNLPVVEFRISALMNSLLGATEQRFAQAFQTLEAMSPNVVFIDEIEKAFGGDQSERDGGTMMRCTGALLSWLSDNPYPNFIVATSNSLTRMGEIGLTMTRSERFDASFFVDVPSRDSRSAMLAQWLKGIVDQPDNVAADLADLTHRFSGADLRSIVKHAEARAERRRIPVSLESLRAEGDRKKSRALALFEEFQGLRRWGHLHCDPAGPTD